MRDKQASSIFTSNLFVAGAAYLGFSLCRRPQCGGDGCASSGSPTYSNKDCCTNGVLNNQSLCSATTAAPCILSGKLVVPPEPHSPIVNHDWPPQMAKETCGSFFSRVNVSCACFVDREAAFRCCASD